MKMYSVFLALTTLCLVSCISPFERGGQHNITFVNNSKDSIACQVLVSRGISLADTIYQCNIGAVGIDPNSSYKFGSTTGSNWQRDLSNVPYVQFLVMDRELYGNYIGKPCDSTRKHVPVLKYYHFTLAELKDMNWTIVHDGK